METPASTEARHAGAFDRALGALLLALMFLGCFALWIAVPGAVLWLTGKMVDKVSEHYTLAVVAVPLGMILWGFVLVRLNALYLRVSGIELEQEEDGEWLPRFRGPLDRILGISAVLALFALLAWIAFGPTNPDGGTVW